MSEEGRITLMGLATGLFGVVLIVLGLLLAYFSLGTDVDLVSPRMFTPIGLAVALIGGFMLVAREA
ncbi:hypothetical protein AC482_00530 [miscellaneous Crenarchaeota group-15 archaeon DG-45]|uniref:Major facilitator superfamily (MFS) profile domain-containing protein n=1 Tax=miscellaneous Crenarchaeota group-15 archaeon DG-45 TaxID=1685127 RepID=A0A0M0BSV7_9ARCH|nr:MAG: hypothetical protein AC482_00530 [miscellaneous Crenarchaeota group-15 archaeon DG-45]